MIFYEITFSLLSPLYFLCDRGISIKGTQIRPQPGGGITDELDVTATARRKAELVLDDVAVASYRR